MAWFDTLPQRIKRILLHEWDPIGVAGVPAAQDEYDSYVRPLADMLDARRPVAELTAYLLDIETGAMGLRGDEARARRVAGLLSQLFAP